ncbi:hypothetical protein LGH70_16480 [Hymenobacter sp. BT635]|uniref:PepSY domain-containing protein n=1 Tax=Hymenobacter nitidus TaxID=2880929 RepID=A0ABS8AHP7_9BACT|nr:hypothetical protein [Hymenobacter nitidus]MCB2379197.1 hypothetical protein [Hymenobacter nitidus]
MKHFLLKTACALLLAACSADPAAEQRAIAAVEQYVKTQVDAPITPVHSEAFAGHQEDADGRNRKGYTVEYTFEMEPTPGKKEKVTAVYFADTAGNVMPSTK